MAIKISNTLTDKKELFIPQKNNYISMYICGITPYDNVHLGHARVYTVFDIIKRHFINRGYEVNHIQNFTDIDDKIIKRATEQNKTAKELSNIYIDDYFEQMDKLNILRANQYPRVSQMSDKIISFISSLIEKGFAYEVNGDVFFSIDNFKDYGKLSKKNIEDLIAGSRVEINDDKKSPFDFALWKKAKEHEPSDICWDSPWGKGRPGWHIECSVMATSILGDTIDIHGGGQDLIFPHHENEIAQSEAKSQKQFAKYWIHNGFVTVNKEKMSKSLGNFFTLKDILGKYNPRAVRYYLLTQHYKSPLDFSDLSLEAAKNALQGLDDAYLRLSQLASKQETKITDSDLIALRENFLSSLDDDFNSEKALSYLHEIKNTALKELFKSSKQRLAQIKTLYEYLSVNSLGITLPDDNEDTELNTLLEERNNARKTKNWTEADRLRKLIESKNYKIVDNPDGTSSLTKKL
jgi:cysteinyl-tRNA synthetase